MSAHAGGAARGEREEKGNSPQRRTAKLRREERERFAANLRRSYGGFDAKLFHAGFGGGFGVDFFEGGGGIVFYKKHRVGKGFD